MQTNLVYWIFGVIICKYLKDIKECRDLYFKLKKKLLILILLIIYIYMIPLEEILLILYKYIYIIF